MGLYYYITYMTLLNTNAGTNTFSQTKPQISKIHTAKDRTTATPLGVPSFNIPKENINPDVFTVVRINPAEQPKHEAKPGVKQTTEPTTEPTVKIEPSPDVKPAPQPNPLRFPRPFLDIFWNEELQEEIPLDIPYVDKMGEKRVVRRKQKATYKYRPRTAPIVEGAERLFEMPSNVAPKKIHKRTKIYRPKKASKQEDFWTNYNLEMNTLVPAKREKKPTTESGKEFWEI